MEKVLRNIEDNSIIILFVVVMFAATLYMGFSERRLSSLSHNNINIVENR